MRFEHWLYTIPLRLRSLFRRGNVEQDLNEELEFHVEMQTRTNLAHGMTASEARRRARVQFGVEAAVKEECRDQRRVSLIETLWQDVRYALRGFRRTPAFALTVAATIGLGIGVNVAVFTIFNAYVLRPVAVRDPYSIYEFSWTYRNGERAFTPADYEALRGRVPVFSDIHAVRGLQTRLNGRNAFGQLVSGNYFHMLGIGTAFGRTILPEDASEPVIVLSYAAWRSMFAADPEIIGKKVRVHGYSLEVIGVAQDGFGGVAEIPQDFWAPLSMIGQLDPDRTVHLNLFGRLKPGFSVAQAQAALSTIARQLTADRPETERPVSAMLRSRATTVPLSRQALLLLSPIIAAFGLVLLIACANVANMMLARAMARQREIGIRLSLGAARARLIHQLLTESVLLAVPSAAIGFVISQGIIAAGLRAMFATLPAEFVEFIRVAPLSPDGRVFTFMMVIAILASIVFGLAPAIQATRGSVIQAARGDFTNEHRPARLRNALVIAQIGGCAALLIASGVLLNSAKRIGDINTGLRTRDVIDLEIQEKSRARVLAALASEPLVDTVAVSAEVPLDGGFPAAQVSAPGATSFILASYDYVSPEFFDVFAIPILRGRNFTRDEARSGAPVTVVSRAVARRLWPDRDAVGQSLRLARDPSTHRPGALRYPEVRVIGVAEDILTGFSDDDSQRSYIFFATHPAAPGNALAIRVKGDTEAARQRLDAALTAADPGAVNYIHKMDEFKAGRLYPFRVAWWVSAAVGMLALLLAVAGVYGVLSYVVTQRTKEIGVRMAMGASEGDVVKLVLRQSMRLAAIGLTAAVLFALGISSLMATQIMMIRVFEPAPYAGAVLLVLAACAGAAFFPSRRAARVDPVKTLRWD